MKTILSRFLVVFLACFALATFKGCHCEADNDTESDPDSGPDEQECLVLNELLTSTVTPAGVRTVFQLLDCDGYPIPDLDDDEIEVLLDGEPIRTEGDVASVLNQEVKFQSYAVLLLDLSDSIVDSGNLEAMVSAARNLVHKLISDGQNVAVYQFAGPKYFAEVQSFTTDETSLDTALEDLSESNGLGTTDLYGSIPRALEVLEDVGSKDVLTTRTLVIFTDGSDEAMAATRSSAEKAINASDSQVFTVGLGGDVNQQELLAFGKNGFEWAEDADKLDIAFAAITKRISDLARSHYLLGICSPRAGGWREMSLIVRRDGESGRLDVHYDATGFDIVGCSAEEVAFPCKDKQCGEVSGLSCGSCSGTMFCTDEMMCEDACADAECGAMHGIDCGDCSELGDTFACDAHSCEDACFDAECGTVLGVDCGDCESLGDSFACDSDHNCVDACQEAECGTVLGMDCGDCESLGDEFGCDENHECVEACKGAECGTVMGIDCGDCSSSGDNFGCDAEHKCVDVCSDAECGTVQGVNCGGCDDSFSCNEENLCVPTASLPGVSWIRISGGDFTLGCDVVLDPSCGLDEARRQVTLSDFWIMDTEVTVGMYATCLSDEACNASYVDTGSECNFGAAPSGREDHPINCITAEGLKQFCAYVGGRLPTEAQWERAFRGDHDDVTETYWVYPWGNAPAPSRSKVVMNEDGPGCGAGTTSEVGGKPTTGFGLLNMAGNVSEWTGDYYGESFEDCSGEPCVDPTGPADGSERVVRGGAFDDFYASAFRTARRSKEEMTTRSPAIGGRCVR